MRKIVLWDIVRVHVIVNAIEFTSSINHPSQD